MAVIIRNMEMPESCYKCKICRYGCDYKIDVERFYCPFVGVVYQGCYSTGTDNGFIDSFIYPDCPLFPLDYDLLERKLDDGR